jgi:hypothetical protein
MSFDYPQGMNMSEYLGSYPGYATVKLGTIGENQIDLLYIAFLNGSIMSSAFSEDPLEDAKTLLEGDNMGSDSMGFLHDATDKSSITTYYSDNGLATAEMSFSYSDPEVGDFKGYAFEFFNNETLAAYKVRILSTDASYAEDMKDRLVSSFEG